MKPILVKEADYQDAVDSNLGVCVNCREWTHDSAEPDARYYECPECGEDKVFGAEEALLCGFITFPEA